MTADLEENTQQRIDLVGRIFGELALQDRDIAGMRFRQQCLSRFGQAIVEPPAVRCAPLPDDQSLLDQPVEVSLDDAGRQDHRAGDGAGIALTFRNPAHDPDPARPEAMVLGEAGMDRAQRGRQIADRRQQSPDRTRWKTGLQMRDSLGQVLAHPVTLPDPSGRRHRICGGSARRDETAHRA